MAVGVLFCTVPIHAEPLIDRLYVPAQLSSRSVDGLLNALDLAGDRLVAAGQRGHILWSDDQGRNWTQAQVPVSSDLTALQFIDSRQGWAIGHDGVVLHSVDGGESWQQQLDGQRIADLLRAHVATLDPETMKSAVRELERSAGQGADQSLLDLHFIDEHTGYVVGANNLVLLTRDGGRSWLPCSERVANPRALHLYGIAEADGRLFIVGEQGLILRQSLDGQSFDALPSPYQGSWFGILGRPDRLLVYGLRGNAWVSADAGESWRQSTLDSSVALTAASVAGDGQLLLASLGGEVFRSRDGGQHFQELALDQRFPFSAIAVPAGADIVVAGIHGVRIALPQAEAQRQ